MLWVACAVVSTPQECFTCLLMLAVHGRAFPDTAYISAKTPGLLPDLPLGHYRASDQSQAGNTQTWTRTHAPACTLAHSQTHTHTHTFIKHTLTGMRTYAHTHAHIQYARKHTYAQRHTQICTLMHARTHAFTNLISIKVGTEKFNKNFKLELVKSVEFFFN